MSPSEIQKMASSACRQVINFLILLEKTTTQHDLHTHTTGRKTVSAIITFIDIIHRTEIYTAKNLQHQTTIKYGWLYKIK